MDKQSKSTGKHLLLDFSLTVKAAPHECVIRHFSVTADLRICKMKYTLDLRYLRGDISAV